MKIRELRRFRNSLFPFSGELQVIVKCQLIPEITAIIVRNRGDFLRKSRQLPAEITVISEGKYGDF
jgi:hypothetical protein